MSNLIIIQIIVTIYEYQMHVIGEKWVGVISVATKYF